MYLFRPLIHIFATLSKLFYPHFQKQFTYTFAKYFIHTFEFIKKQKTAENHATSFLELAVQQHVPCFITV